MPDVLTTYEDNEFLLNTTFGIDNSYTILYNDGSVEQDGQTDPTLAHVFTGPGMYEVIGKATDREMNYIEASRLITV